MTRTAPLALSFGFLPGMLFQIYKKTSIAIFISFSSPHDDDDSGEDVYIKNDCT